MALTASAEIEIDTTDLQTWLTAHSSNTIIAVVPCPNRGTVIIIYQ